MKSPNVEQEINELLSRGVGSFIDPEDVFKKKLIAKAEGRYNKPIIIKFGVDPTRPDIHLGHAVVFRKLRKFQELGCKVVFLIGDFTAQIGDPTGKSKVRPEIALDEVRVNMKTYLDQVGKILLQDPAVFSWITNSEWFITISDIAAPNSITMNIDNHSVTLPANSFLAKTFIYEQTRMQITQLQRTAVHDVTLRTFFSMLRHITHAQLIERDMFQDRLKKGNELYMHEMMYPILQGIDSNLIAQIYGSCDLEIGGTDQTFNMLMGRTTMRISNLEPQSVMSIELLIGTDGKEKMSKSLDNYIAITDAPADMYGKVMSVPDHAIPTYFELATFTPVAEIKNIKDALADTSVNPKEYKMRLAREIVAIYHGEHAAAQAEKNFEQTFAKGGVPDDIQTVTVQSGMKMADVLVEAGVVSSKTDWKRLVTEGAVKRIETDTTITDQFIEAEAGTYKIGKRRFIKLVK